MNDYSNFWQIECIKQLDSGCLGQFKKVFENYAPNLLPRLDVEGGIYTLHDKNHCMNLYKIISKIILHNNIAYDTNYGLTSRELFILDLAVLFHDIGMSDVINPQRKNHSKAAADYVEKEYNDNRSCLKKTDLTPLEKKALKAIIKAHSDIKDDPTINPNKNGLFADDLKAQYEDIQSKPIRALLLAGILRLADELDVTSARLGNSLVETQLQELDEELKLHQNDDKYKKLYAGYIESKKHWKRLHLFELVSLNEENGTIELVVDDEYVVHQTEYGDTEKSIAYEISNVVMKIEKELKIIKERCFSKPEVRSFVFLDKIQAKTKLESLEVEIQKEQSILNLPMLDTEFENASKQMTEEEYVITEKKIQPNIIDLELSKKISEEVRERQLLKFGHYRLNDIYCARDWLNVMELVETREISKKIVNAIVKHINARDLDNIVILGMDMVGALLAARIAFALQKPMSYFVSLKNQQFNSEQDIEFKIQSDEKVVIITESIATFKTIEDAINEYGLSENVDSIYTVFYRKTQLSNLDNTYVDKTFSLNNDFPIEIVEKNRCIHKECLGTNRY